jgi:hypothetical protein
VLVPIQRCPIVIAASCFAIQNCIICTFLNWRGLLADDVARGDLAFGNLLLKHVPFVHRGYFLYAK